MARAGRFVRAAVAAGVLSTPLVACFDWSSLSSLCGAPLSAAYVVPGHSHTCARTTDGALFCWGDNRHGQLGTGDTVAHAAPTRVPISGGAARIYLPTGDGEYTSETGAFTCVQTAAGALLCWGDNTYGQLGTGGGGSQLTPTGVPLNAPVDNACAGAEHVCAQTTDGAILCWGNNTYGQLGTGDTNTRHAPAQLDRAAFANKLAGGSLFCGAYHTCAETTDGTLFCWGDNRYGQLGLGHGAPTQVTHPTALTFASGDPQVNGGSAGAAFTCVERADNSVVCWGDNTYGQLGTGDLKARSSADTSSPALTDAQSVFAGETFACATTKKGALECWGDNRYGELGVGDTSARSKPTAVPPGTLGLTAGGAGVTAMSAGGDHACAIAAGGVWCWGDNTYGELGTSSASSKVTTSPTAVAGIGCP